MHTCTQTHELNLSSLRLPFQILLFLVGMGLILEIVFRIPVAKQYLPIPSLGTANRVFEQKAIILEAYVQNNGQLDCVFIGNSTTRRALDPSTIAASYKEGTGVDLNCFNFGVPGLTTQTSFELSRWMIEKYSPEVIFYGTTMRDPIEMESANYVFDSISNNAWFRHQKGEFNWEGWLIDSSMLMRYVVYVSNWVLPGPVSDNFKPGQLLKYQLLESDGYTYVEGQDNPNRDLTVPPNPDQEPKYFDMVTGYVISDTWLELVQEYVTLNAAETEIVFLEIPLPEYALNYAMDDFHSYRYFVELVGQTLLENDALYISSQNVVEIPQQGWYDRSHMNWEGAESFSDWVGTKLAQLANNGNLALPTNNQ